MRRRRERAGPGRAPAGLATVVAGAVAVAASSVAPSALGAQATPVSSTCAGCHRTLSTERLSRPALSFPADVHAAAGFGCIACHGSGPEGIDAPLDPDAGFLARPSRREIPEMCGRCHSDAAFMRDFDPSLRVDQVAEFRTSTHGRLLLEESDPDVATCTSCHPAHETRPPSDPESTVHPLNVASTCGACHADEDLMNARGHSSDQLDEWSGSVHGVLMLEEGDVSAPTCNDCHGNHGAAPPGVNSVRNVCGQCHATMADYFSESGHVEPFDIEDRPGCSTCHGNHDVQRPRDVALVSRSESVCDDCHDQPGDPYGDEFRSMAALIDSLIAERTRAHDLLEEAENRGMEVSQALFELEDVGNALTRARSAIHSFHVEPVEEQVAAGLEVTERALARGREALDEHRFRRVGLAASSLVILALIGGLLLKIRQLDRTRPAEESSSAGKSGPGGAPTVTSGT